MRGWLGLHWAEVVVVAAAALMAWVLWMVPHVPAR
jgi:hypothetical protein